MSITLLSATNSAAGGLENICYWQSIRKESSKPPVFVLGHWRSGTTYLHQLLSLDERFATSTLADVLFPYTCLSVNDWIVKLLKRFESKRPSDGMSLSLQSPYEDEFAICVMSLLSAQLSMVFPRQEAFYDRFVTFQDASQEEVEQFKSTLLTFYKKLTLKYDNPLLLKSPAHTGRIRLLLELFPDAKFIHLSRDPYRVFQSTVLTMQRSLKNQALQQRESSGFEERTLRQYEQLYDAYLRDRSLIPNNQLVEVRFENMIQNPKATLLQIYQGLEIENFESVWSKMNNSIDQQQSHRQNPFEEISAETKQVIADRWKRFFTAFEYEV